MNYEESREYLRRAQKKGVVLGLELMRDLLNRMGNPQNQLRFVHIAGTNGKGSVLAYVSTILKEAGFRVGRYISPVLYGYEERIQINEEWIPRDMVAEGITEIAEKIQEMEQCPTVFEIETALSFWYFEKKNCDVVVLETGMGGDMDATNVISTTICSVLTSISVDHKKVLGNSLEEIAGHKAGIIKPGVPVVLLHQSEETEKVVENRCRELGCELTLADGNAARIIMATLREQIIFYKSEQVSCHLLGEFQKDNIAVAIEVIWQLQKQKIAITRKQMEDGIAATHWKGRMELVSEEPKLLADGAHNPDAAGKLRKSLEMYFTNQKFIFIIGVLADKDYETIVQIMMPKAGRVFVITPDHPRALSAKELYSVIKKRFPLLEVSIAASVLDAWTQAEETVGQDEVIVAFGSLSFLGELEAGVKGVKA